MARMVFVDAGSSARSWCKLLVGVVGLFWVVTFELPDRLHGSRTVIHDQPALDVAIDQGDLRPPLDQSDESGTMNGNCG